MTVHPSFPVAESSLRLSTDKPLSVAILAMGGQGGGVLADWIVAAAEGAGWMAQSTSVPGVAQRTGATIYYIEMLPERDGTAPILSLMPTPGDVDVVLAAEFMEAGRSMLRGLVTPDRTTLVTSSHRSYAVGEKEVPGDGIGDPESVVEAAGIAAKRIVAFDMQTLAERNGSVISATMFGALAGAGVLPFAREHFEAAIRAGGKGVEPSLRAFAAGFDKVAGKVPREIVPKAPGKDLPEPPASVGVPALDALLARIAALPGSVRPMAYAGVKRLVDYQDPAYAAEYLSALEGLRTEDERAGGAAKGWRFTENAAKYLAVAMAYDDVVRVADLKTRSARLPRIRREVGAKDDQILGLTEYMHPRMEEVAGALPARLGHAIESRPKLFAALDRIVNRGRRVRTDRIHWFLALYAVAGLKRFRRGTLRHEREAEHWTRWLALARQTLPDNYDLAVAILSARRLVKGYSDTHARGHSKFDRVLTAVPTLRPHAGGGAWLERLIKAALLDEEGKALDGALLTVASAYETS